MLLKNRLEAEIHIKTTLVKFKQNIGRPVARFRCENEFLTELLHKVLPNIGIARNLTTLTQARIQKYRLYNVNFDPSLHYANPLPPQEMHHPGINMHHVIPSEELATAESLQYTVHKNIRAARHSAESSHWQQAYEQEIAMQYAFGTFRYVTRSSIHPRAIVARTVLALRRKYDKHSGVIGLKPCDRTRETD